MADGTFDPMWTEVAIVTIMRAGGTARQFAAITDEIEINTPDYPGESMPNTAGGRIWKQSPQEDGEVTLKLYPIKEDDADNAGITQGYLQAGGQAFDSTEPLRTRTSFTAGVSKKRDSYIVAVMWTQDTAVASALSATSTSALTSRRFYAKLARIISYKEKFSPSDGLSAEVTFKFPAMNKAGDTRPFAWESTVDSSTTKNLPALTYASETDL